MTGEKRYRAGAIGRTGRGNFGHGMHLAYQDIPNVDFVAVADEDEAGRARAAEQTGAASTYADYREMLAKEALDLVSVGPRWVDCHEEMVVACVVAGCHVYAEKPLAMDPASADRIVAAAEKANRKVAVAHQAVYLPQVQAARQMVREGRIGKVLCVTASGKQDHRGGGEDMIVLGTHLFNMMRFFVGDPLWVTAQVTSGGRPIGPSDVREGNEPIGPVAGDHVESLFGFAQEITGHFVSRANQPGSGQGYGLVLIGDAGRLAIGGGASHLALWKGDVWAPWEGGCEWTPLQMHSEPLQGGGNRLAVLDLIAAIEEDRAPLSSARDARWALEMILGAYASQRTRARVGLPLEIRSHPLDDFTGV